DVEAYSAGKIGKIVAPVGATVPCGAPIAILLEEGDDASALTSAPAPKASSAGPAAHVPPTAHAAPAPKAAPAPAERVPLPAATNANANASANANANANANASAAANAPDRIRASPLARRMAKDSSLDLGQLHGSGPQGRIIKADIERALTAPPPAHAPASLASASAAPARPAPARLPPAPLKDELVPLSGMRKAIARRMAEAKPGAPHFYLTIDVDMAKALALRAQVNEQLGPDWGVTVSVNDLLLKASALALLRHPSLNATFAGESVQRHGAVHVGFALAVDEGLLTPVIRNTAQLSLGEIAKQSKDLAERGRARKLRPDEYQGGTFTVSNLGMFGIKEFSAIINPGEAAILAVGAVEKRPVVVNDQLAIGQVMSATLSGDHRVIDGAVGARFLQDWKALLEQPLRLLA
ncbi:MAG: 2-oxo acid dehydrogenase subunit E2, partial [Deltaproteobacteria bacterium]|nr:2-oxo acid dehydrogenase subunit E2 [Deltaproteobacteria bacterium]